MAGAEREELILDAGEKGPVTALLTHPPGTSQATFVFAHGAGAGMRHAFMADVADRLAALGTTTLRYQFPYMEAGRKAPDRPPVLIETVRAAVREAGNRFPGVPLIAGGKSMGGRMTSTAASTEPLPGVVGLAFFGFPLHPPGRESIERGKHLGSVGLPMLFLQGTRDKLANLELLEPLLGDVSPRPTLHVVEGADHGFHVLKRSGRTDDEVLEEACRTFSDWVEALT